MSVDPARRCANESAGEPCAGDAHFCWKQQGDVIGDAYSATSYLIEKPASFTGIVAAERSFCGELNVTINGSLVVGQNAAFKGASVLIASDDVGVSSPSLRAMVETSW
jgi:hypothetical protein